jgi:hypothetical protein
MRLDVLVGVVKRFFRFGIFLMPLSKRCGGGWRGSLIGAMIRALVFGVPYLLVSYFFSRESFGVANYILVSVFFLDCLFTERSWSRQ